MVITGNGFGMRKSQIGRAPRNGEDLSAIHDEEDYELLFQEGEFGDLIKRERFHRNPNFQKRFNDLSIPTSDKNTLRG